MGKTFNNRRSRKAEPRRGEALDPWRAAKLWYYQGDRARRFRRRELLGFVVGIKVGRN